MECINTGSKSLRDRIPLMQPASLRKLFLLPCKTAGGILDIKLKVSGMLFEMGICYNTTHVYYFAGIYEEIVYTAI